MSFVNALSLFNNDLVSFQNGVDTIVDGCTTYGSTPTASTPSSIVNSIKAIYNNRYNAGVSATKKGNATAAQVLSGKTFTNASSVNISGTMTNNGAKTASLNCGGSYTIPAGYHNGMGKITANTLASQTSATATAKMITKGYTAWVNGVKITGTRVAPVTKLSGTFELWIPLAECVTTKIVEFSTPFDKVPTVSISITGTGNQTTTDDWKIDAVTRTNFTFSTMGKNWKYVTITVKWVAEA